jgi:hypothetical protein
MDRICSTHGRAKGRDHSEDLDIDEKIIIEWLLNKHGGKVWTGRFLLRIGTSDRNETSDTIKGIS